jgi:putative endonuclease
LDGRRGLGQAGEEIAVAWLVEAGMRIVERNWRCPHGELDIVAHDVAADYVQGGVEATWLVLVEVRTRRGYSFGSAREAVDRRKQAKLREVASCYVQSTGWSGPWRIDVVAVQMDCRGRLESVELIRNAVTAE